MARHRSIAAKTDKASSRTAGAAAKLRATAKARSVFKERDVRSAGRRDAILKAALAEFSARGFEATRLDDIANRANIAKGTIYLYFRDKESLFQDLIRDMLSPVIAAIQTVGETDVPLPGLAERLTDMFVREIYETPRKDIIRLVITEGRRFPNIAEFYHREVLSHVMTAVRGMLRRAAQRGEVSPALIEFPQLLAAPALVAIVWSGLFERLEPLDVRGMLKTHFNLLICRKEAP